MKKLMSLLTLLICTMGAMAQDWTNPHGDTGFGGWTTVFADLTVTGLGIGDWAQSPIPNPQSPIPNPQSPLKLLLYNKLLYYFFLS